MVGLCDRRTEGRFEFRLVREPLAHGRCRTVEYRQQRHVVLHRIVRRLGLAEQVVGQEIVDRLGLFGLNPRLCLGVHRSLSLGGACFSAWIARAASAFARAADPLPGLGPGRVHRLPHTHGGSHHQHCGRQSGRRGAALFRRASLPKRYQLDGGRASTGSSVRNGARRRPRRWRSRSAACGPSPAPSSRSSPDRRCTRAEQLRRARSCAGPRPSTASAPSVLSRVLGWAAPPP